MKSADIYIINRENVQWLIEESGLPFDFDTVVVDELSSFKSYQAKRFRALMKVRPKVKRIVGLTGTPSSNGLMDLWAEFRLLDMGHPDKLCDLIADSILDACLRKDKSARVACEVMATKGKIIVAGEITCDGKVDIRWEVREVLRKVGYNPWKFTVFVFVHKQSADISAGVTTALEARNGSEERYASIGAGDQGTVYGYATNETREMLPLPLVLAHRICKRVDTVRKDKIVKGILPDGKAQVTVEYEDEKPKRVKTIVVSVQHDSIFHYWMKQYDEGSQFGIEGGRISKLTLKRNGTIVCNYDRGWDIEPADPDTQLALEILLQGESH